MISFTLGAPHGGGQHHVRVASDTITAADPGGRGVNPSRRFSFFWGGGGGACQFENSYDLPLPPGQYGVYTILY